MSSSRQSAPSTRKARRGGDVRFSSLTCPMCGRRGLIDVVEDCELSGGRLVKRLRHTRCRFCGERFFDVAAMTVIEKASSLSASKWTA